MSSRTRQQLEEWIKTKSLSGRILDVGGSQLSIKGRANVEGEVVVLDLPVPHQGNKPDIEMDLNNMAPNRDDMGTFDYAVCLEVSEYWYDPLMALINIKDFLKTGGTLFISFHFIYPVHNPVEQDYLRYTRRGAMKLLNEAGFEVVDVQSRNPNDNGLYYFYEIEGMRPAKDYKLHKEVGILVEAIKK